MNVGATPSQYGMLFGTSHLVSIFHMTNVLKSFLPFYFFDIMIGKIIKYFSPLMSLLNLAIGCLLFCTFVWKVWPSHRPQDNLQFRSISTSNCWLIIWLLGILQKPRTVSWFVILFTVWTCLTCKFLHFLTSTLTIMINFPFLFGNTIWDQEWEKTTLI